MEWSIWVRAASCRNVIAERGGRIMLKATVAGCKIGLTFGVRIWAVSMSQISNGCLILPALSLFFVICSGGVGFRIRVVNVFLQRLHVRCNVYISVSYDDVLEISVIL